MDNGDIPDAFFEDFDIDAAVANSKAQQANGTANGKPTANGAANGTSTANGKSTPAKPKQPTIQSHDDQNENDWWSVSKESVAMDEDTVSDINGTSCGPGAGLLIYL